MSLFNEIKKISDETRKKIELLSARSLPNNPSERGMTPEQIKKRFYDPILSSAASALKEIDRVVDEVNDVILQIDKSTGETRQTADNANRASSNALKSASEAAAEARGAKGEAVAAAASAEDAAEKAAAGAAEAAEAAAAAEAAKNAILELEVTAETAEPGAFAMAEANIEDGKIAIHLTLPRGIQGPQGIQGEHGEGFVIKKVYTSVEEMEKGFERDGLPEGSFVLVRPQDESIEDYGKLYVKGGSAYVFMVDMSVSIKGDPGDPGYTPQFGVDYWTEEHQSAIVAMIRMHVSFEVSKQVGVIEDGSY